MIKNILVRDFNYASQSMLSNKYIEDQENIIDKVIDTYEILWPTKVKFYMFLFTWSFINLIISEARKIS